MEIRRIREMMNLSLLTEQKDELYNLLIKLGREAGDEAEKIEIRNALKKQGFSDVEIRSIAAGGEDILNNAVRRLEQKVASQGLGEFEQILVKQGISKDAIASLPDGDYFIDGIEGLYTRKKNGLITDAQYQEKLNDVINALSDVANEAELKRAIKSIELDVDKKVSGKIETEIPQNRPLTTEEIVTNPQLTSTLEELVGTDIAKQARKKLKGMSDAQIKTHYIELKNGLIRDEELKKRISDAFAKNPSLRDKWKTFNFWQQSILIPTIAFGILYTLAYLKNRSLSGLIEDTKDIWKYIDDSTKSGEEKQKTEKKEEITNYLKRLENYRVLSIDGTKLSDIDNFYLNKLIDDFGTIQNDLKNKITSKINTLVSSLVSSKEGTVDSYGMYQIGEEISNEINEILSTVAETKNFKVEVIKEGDDDYLKPGVETALKGLKNLLPTSTTKKQSSSWERPKQELPSNF